jgi:hypothetical protein
MSLHDPCHFVLSALFFTAILFFAPRAASAADAKKVVIPFDFVSKFDSGRYGQTVGELIWKRLQREGRFILPESMLDVRETIARTGARPVPGMAIEKVKQIVQRDFDAQIGIWGSVERAAGHQEDIYDLVIRCVDFSAVGGPKVVYECNARTRTVSEIPHVYVKQMVDALCGRAPGGPPAVDATAEANWKKNPNLVLGGDFQSGTSGVPKGWEPVAGQQREPLGKVVRWVPESGNGANKIIRFVFDAGVGDNEGVMYYSLPFVIEEGAKYRFQCRWRTSGPRVKVFIKCYDEVDSEYRANAGSAPSGSSLGKKDYIPKVSQMREVYRSQQNLQGPKNTWNSDTADFTPKHTRYTPRWGRVMLYAYVGAGTVEFDDVVVKQIVSAPPGEKANKMLRPSAESKVTVEEMEAE